MHTLLCLFCKAATRGLAPLVPALGKSAENDVRGLLDPDPVSPSHPTHETTSAPMQRSRCVVLASRNFPRSSPLLARNGSKHAQPDPYRRETEFDFCSHYSHGGKRTRCAGRSAGAAGSGAQGHLLPLRQARCGAQAVLALQASLLLRG